MSPFVRANQFGKRYRAAQQESVWALVLMLGIVPAAGQAPRSTQPAEAELIQLELPENMEVSFLIDYVSERLGLNIVYDDAVGRKRVTISSPAKISKESLLGLLRSVLKMSGLALVEAEQPGWLRVVQSRDLLDLTEEVRKRPGDLVDVERTTPVTLVFQLRHVTMSAAERVIRPVLTKPGGNLFAISDQNVLVVTDYAGNVRRIRSMLELVDRPGPDVAVRFVEAEHMQASRLATDVQDLIQTMDGHRAGGDRAKPPQITLKPYPRTNRIAIIAPEARADEAMKLIRLLDVPVATETVTYSFRHVSPQRVGRLARELIAAETGIAAYTSAVDEEFGLLIVSALPPVHEQILSLKSQLDVPKTEDESNIRFYKLMNSTATEVLSTIQSLRSGGGMDALKAAAARGADERPGGGPFIGPNLPPGEALDLMDSGQLEQAEEQLKAALAADLFYGPAHNNLGTVYYEQGVSLLRLRNGGGRQGR